MTATLSALASVAVRLPDYARIALRHGVLATARLAWASFGRFRAVAVR